MIQLDNCVERFGAMILTELKEAGVSVWAAGGCLRDYFAGKPIKTDVDLFFPDKENMEKCVAYLKKNHATEIYANENGAKYQYGKHTYDIIKHYFDGPQATIDAFDFTVSMFAVDAKQVYFGESSFIDLSKRQLMINKISFPASTVSRAFRYYTKGFRMCKGEMKKLIESCQTIAPKVEESDEPQEEIISGDGFFTGID